MKGYDLTFTTDSPDIAKIYSSYEFTDTKNMGLYSTVLVYLDYSSLKSIDVRSYGSLVGLGKLALLALRDNNKEVATWVGDFKGYQYLPSFAKFRTLALPTNLSAICFDFRLTSDNGDGILNCQVIPTGQNALQDLLCHVAANET